MRATGDPGLQLANTVGNVLDHALAREPQREALVARDGHLTYEELDDAVERAARALSSVGIRQNEVVAVSLPNTKDVVITFYAVMRLGAVWLGINRNLAPPEKHFILRDADAQLLLADADVADALDAKATPRTVVVSGDGATWQAMLVGAPSTYRRPIRRETDAAGVAYTSGTTGRPKGVVHSHRNLLLPGAMFAQARGFGPDLRKGDCAALTILNMQVTSTLLAAQVGGTQIVMDRVDPVGIAHWIRDESVNAWFAVPTLLQRLASAEVAKEDLETLQDVWTGGTFLSEQIRSAFETRFGHRVSATYGLTEVPTVVTIEDRDENRQPDSSGQSLPHLVVEIRDDHGKVLPIGELGEITIRPREDGPWAGLYQPMLGYLGQPAATSSALRGGILHTGDIGQLDNDGHLFVRDRLNALILRGGSNVYPAEVERVLLQFEGVRGASVVGLLDERLGQRVAAALELDGGTTIDKDVLRDFCTAHLARYKVPERWHFGSLPRNAMGKVVRTEVEKLFMPSTEAHSSF